MRKYTVHSEEGWNEILEVAAETDLGFHVRISAPEQQREYRDFISRILFETLVKAGTLEPLAPEARAG
jgi:hypothetical protein